MADEQSIFREKSLKALSKPGELDKFLKVTNPPLWIAMGAVILLLVGTIVWGIFGTMESKVDGVAAVRDGEVICYVRASDINELRKDMPLTVAGKEAAVSEIGNKPIAASSIDDFARYCGGYKAEEYLYEVKIAFPNAGEGEAIASNASFAEKVEIVVGRIHAISFLFSSDSSSEA